MIEDVLNDLYKKLVVSEHDHRTTGLAPTLEEATVHTMLLTGVARYNKVFDEHELKRVNDYMQKNFYEPEQKKVYAKLMKGTQ